MSLSSKSSKSMLAELKDELADLASTKTDGNASFLRAARSGNVDKIIEHLKGNIDINTSNANGLNALHLAAKEGHVHIVTELLKRGANVNAATKKGNTALHIASLAGQAEVARMLVQLGAGVNAQSQNGFTPLYMAAQENHDDVVSFLLAHGANQSLATEDGFTPLAVALQQGHDKVVAVLLENDTKGRVRLPALHIAAKKDDCKAATLLLQSDHNPDVTSKSGFTPLHIAAHYGNENIAKILLGKGADVNYAAKHQITPLHVASKWGKMNMVLLLLEQGANIEASTRDGLTPLHCAARSGHDQVVDVLLEKGAPFLAKTKNGLAPLHMASQGDHIDSARILLYHKAPVDDVTVDYLTALHVAAHCGHVKVAKLLLDRKADANARALNGFTPLHIACKKNRIKVVELLLKHGASIEATTESGLTPLHVASFMGCMNIVIFLIQSGAHPDVPTVRGETPLHLAARANQTDIIRILLRNGASVDARAREDQTPLHIASRLGNVDIVSLLLQHGAAVDATTKDLYTALHIAAKEDQEEVASSLLDHGAALAATTKKGFTPLHLAAKYGNIKVARLLIQKNAAVDAQGKNGVTPLHVAAHYDHVNVALLLLDKGASPHATAKNGYTPLHIAAKKNQMDIASTLLEYGAKTNAESKAGFTPLHLSSQEGHVDMSSLLIENKADVNHKANNGLTPLHLCAQDDRVDVAHILVGHKAEIGPQTKAGYTPLHVASHFGQMNMVRFLLQHGADVHTTTAHGYTSLHQAAQQGHTLAVNLLLENQASPNVTTSQGQTPLSIAQRLGYISVVETLKVVTETIVTTTTTTVTEEKYKVVAPETMQETFMTDSEDEGGEEAMLGDQSYGYLTADEMKSLGDDSLPIDVTKDEKHQDLLHNIKQFGAPMVEEDKLSPQHATPVEGGFSEKFSPDNIDLERAPMHAGRLKWKTFLVSFMVDARGGAMRGCRHSGVRVIIPPRKASMPMRITCRFLRREKLIHPPPLMEGEACASRILEMGPVGAKFLGPVIIEVPHFASTRGKEREITILRSDTGETWKEHTLEASEEAVQEVLNESFEGEELSALEDLNTNRITRILTTDFPQYFAIVTRVRQEVHGVGPEGGMVSSTVVPQVQAVFPEGALTKKIRVGLQAQPIAPELVAKLLGNRVAVSPIVTVEPRRRKFHKPITLTIPVPQATTKGMINQYSGDAPTLRLLCSITGSTKSGGSSKAQWEDVTGSTPLTFVNDCVSFTTTVSARFWLMDCRQVNEVTRFATELYQEAVYVPFMSKFVVFAKRQDAYEAQLRVFCMTDDREDKTLECQEHFTEIAKSRDVEVLEGKLQYLEFAGNIAPVTKSGEQLRLAFQAFHENRLPFTVRVRDPHAEPLGRVAFMREPKMGRGEPPQVPICNLNVALPDTTLTEATSSDVIELVKLEKRYDFVQEAGLSKPELIHRADLRLSDIAQGLDKDWVLLAKQLEVSDSDVQQIQADTTCDQPEQALIMLRLWLQKSGSKATGNELEKGLRKINREDIIKSCMFNVELVTDDVEKAVAKVHLDQSGFDVFKEELGSSREASMRRGASLDVSYDEQDIMKDAESAAETSSETGSLFDKDQISHALTEDRDARIRRASKTPPPSPVDKPDKGGESLGKGVEILLSQSSLEEKLKEPVDLANRSYDILGRDELQVRLTESETWPSLELDTSQVSISSLPDDEKSEPTTATASDAVADAAAADKGITFVERIDTDEDFDDDALSPTKFKDLCSKKVSPTKSKMLLLTPEKLLNLQDLSLSPVKEVSEIETKETSTSPHSERTESIKPNQLISTRKGFRSRKRLSPINGSQKFEPKVPVRVDKGLSPIAVFTAGPSGIDKEESEYFVQTYDAPPMKTPESGKFSNKSTAMSPNTMFDARYLKESTTRDNEIEESAKLKLETKQKEKHDKTHIIETVDVDEKLKKLSPEKLSPEHEDNISDASYIKVEKSLTESLLKVEKSTSPFSDLMLDTGIGTDSPVTADTASSPFLLDVQSPSSLTFQSREHCSTQTIQVEMLSTHTSPIDGPFSLQDSNLSFGQTESSLKSDSLDDLSKTLGTPSSDVAEPIAILETALLQQTGTPRHSMREFLQEHVATDPSSFSETDDLPEASQEHSIEQTDDTNNNDALNKILVIESFRNVFATEPPFAIVASKKESRSDLGKKKRSKFGVTGEVLGEDRLLTLHDQLLSEESALESSTDSGVDLKETSQNYAAPSDRIGGSPLKSKDRLSTHSSMERHDSTDYSADASKTPLSEHQDILPDDFLSEIEKQILPSSSEYSEIQTDTVYMQDILESIEQTVQETENFQFKKPDKSESNNDDDDVCIAEDICIKAKAYSYTGDRVEDSHENERGLVKASDVIKKEKEISTNVISSSNVSQKEKKQSESFILEVEEQILSSTASRSFVSPAEINQTFAQEILSNSAVEDTPSVFTVQESDFDSQSTVVEKPIVPKEASLDYSDPFDHSFQDSASQKINIKPMVFRETELKFHVENQFSNRDELICHSSKTFSDLSNITDSKMSVSKDVSMKHERKSVSHMEGTSFDTNWEQSYSTEAVFEEKSEYEGPGVTSVIKTTTQMTTYSSGAPGNGEEGGVDALSLHSEKEKTISPDSPELEKLSFAEKRDFFQKLSETSSANVTPTHTLKSTSEAEGISDTLVSEDMGSAESPDEQLSFKECLKFFEKSGDSPPSPKLEIKDIKKEVWTVVGEDSEKQRLDSMSDVSDIERERDMDVVEVTEKRRSTVSIDEQVSLPLYESKEAYDAVFDSTKDAKVEVVVKTFTPGSEMLEICSVENIPSAGEETHVKRVVSTHSITSQPAGGQSIESCKNIDETIDDASDKDHSKSILHTIEETQAKSLNERDQSQLISKSTDLTDTKVKDSDGSMHDDKFKDMSKHSDDENEEYTFSKCSKRESSTSLAASTEHDSIPISSSEAEKDIDRHAPEAEVRQGSETDRGKSSKTDTSFEKHQEDVVSNEEFISKTFKTITESSYEVSKSTVGAFKNNTGDKVDNKWQRESPDNISIVKDTMEPSLGKSEIFICTEETLDNVKKILSVADAESNVVINENASTSATTQEELVESVPETLGTSQAVVSDDEKISSEITQHDTSLKIEEKKSGGDVFICTEETASLSKKIISEVEKETEQFLTCVTKKTIEDKKEDVIDHEISNDDLNEVKIISKSIFVVDAEIQPVSKTVAESSKNKEIDISMSKSTSSSLELLDNGKGDSKEEIFVSASEASLEDKPEKMVINTADSENKIIKEVILTEVVEEISKTKIIDLKPLETSVDTIISIERVEKESEVVITSENISEQTLTKFDSDGSPEEIVHEISKSDEMKEKSEKEVSDIPAGKEKEANTVKKFEDEKEVGEICLDKVAEETTIPQSQPKETSEKGDEASDDKISDIESLKRKIQSEREIGLHFEENFAGSVGSNEEKSESCLSSVKDHSVEIEFLPNLEVTGDVSESGVDKTGHDASGTPCSFHKEMDFDDRQSDLGDSFEEIERNKIINDFKLENKSPSVEKAEFEEVEKKEQASAEEMIYKESLELQHRSGKETVHSVEVTQFTVDSTEVYNVPSEKLIEKFSSKRIHFESSMDGQEKSTAPHQMNQFLESMIDQGSSMALPSDVTPVHKRTEEWIDQSEAILLREGPLIESSEMPMFEDRLPTTLEDEPHKRSSPTAESFDDKARVEQCDTDVMMQLMDFVSRNDIELAEVRTEDEAPDIEEDVSPTAEEDGSSRMTFDDSKSEEKPSRKDSKSKESLKVTDSDVLLSSPQRSPYDSTNTSPSRKDIGSDTVETVVDGMKFREGSSPRMYPQSSLEVEVGSHDSEEVGTRDPDREMTPLSFVEEESHSKVDLNIRKTSSEDTQAVEAKEQTEKDSSAVREVSSPKETKPSGLGGSLEGEVVSAFEPSVVKQVVQENLEEYIATLSGERSQLPTLDSDQDFERLEKELEESVVVEPQVHAQKLHEENLQTEEVESVVKTVPCAFDNTAFAGAEVIDEVDQKEPIRARSPYEVIRDYEVPEPSHTVTEQTESEDLGTSKNTYESKHVEEDSKGTTRTTYVLKQVEAIRHRPILQHIPSEISEEDLVEREIVSPISRRDSDVLDSPTEGSPRRVSGTHFYQEDDSNVFLSELPAGSGGLWDTSRVTQITTTRTTSRTVSERLEDKDSKDSKTNETGSDSGIFKESVTVTTTCQSIAAPHEKESQPCLPTQQISSSEDARVLNGPGEVDYQPEYDLGGEIVQTRRSGGVYHTDRPLQISTSSSDEFKRRHYSSVSDDVLDSEIGDILRSGQQFDEDIIDRPMTPEPPIDEIEYGISISAKTLSDLTKLELDDDTIQRRVFPDFDDDRIASPPLSPDDSRAGFAYGMQFEKDVLDTVEEAMDMDSDPYSEEKEAVFDYGMRFEREPGLEDDDIRHYGDLYTHQEEDEDALENGDKVKIVAKSKRDSDFDILAGRKFFTKNVEMDELSMSSLQEFERLESELVSGRKSSVGSIDSLNGKPASKSGDHDDVSMSSLTEFERLEKECIEKEGINPAMQESTLSEIEEGHESQASETSQENKSDGCKDESSIAEGFDRHLEDIEKIILKTDSGDKEELSFQHLITQTTKSSIKTTDSTTTSMVSRMHVLQRSQDSFSKSDGRNDDIDQDSLHDELSLKPDSLADDTKHEYLDSLHEGRCDDADSLQGDMPDEMRDSLFEDRHLEDDSLRDMDILPDESSLSMESSLAAPLSHDEVVKEIRHSTQTISKEERILKGTSGEKRAEIVVSELPKGDVMLSSTDSLEQSSSAAAAFHFESESAMSTSLTGHLQSEDNTMISSTDTLEHEGRITFRYEDIPIDDLEILIKDGRQVIVDSEGNVQTEYDVKHFLDNSADNINNEFKFCSKGFIQDTHPSGSMQVEKVMTSLCYSGGPQGTGTGPQTTGTFDTSYSDPEVEIEEIHTTDEFGNPKVIKKIKKVVQSRTQYTSSSSSANVEEKLKDFLREHAAGEGAGIGEELVQEERTIDDKGNVVVVRTVQQQVVSHPEVHSRTFTGPDAGVLSEEYVERFKELDPTDDVCEYEKIDDQGNVVRVTQQVVIKPEVHSISFSGPDAHQQMEEYMKRFTPMSQNGSRTRAGETTYTGAQVSAATEQEYIPSESDSHDMGSTTYIKTTISNIVPESSEQFVVRTTTSTTVTSTDGTVKTNGSPEQKSSPKAD